MNKLALPLVACLLAVAAAGASAQSIWKWRDSSGQMHIGDTPPPPGTPARDITQTPAGAALAVTPTAQVSPASAAAGELQKKKAQADQAKAEQDKAKKAAEAQQIAAARADNCRIAKQQAATMQSGQRVARIAANGEREYLDDAMRNAELQRAQAAEASNCGPASAPN